MKSADAGYNAFPVCACVCCGKGGKGEGQNGGGFRWGCACYRRKGATISDAARHGACLAEAGWQEQWGGMLHGACLAEAGWQEQWGGMLHGASRVLQRQAGRSSGGGMLHGACLAEAGYLRR